jgi:cell division GTPase FtsZ
MVHRKIAVIGIGQFGENPLQESVEEGCRGIGNKINFRKISNVF